MSPSATVIGKTTGSFWIRSYRSRSWFEGEAHGFDLNGGLPHRTQNMVAPTAYISANFPSYASPAQISGARNAGVPASEIIGEQ